MAHQRSNGTPLHWESRLNSEADSPVHESPPESYGASFDARPKVSESPSSDSNYNFNAMIATGQAVPPNMDRESYLAGEKAALLRVFQEVLPSQQAMGALAATVHQLKEQMWEVKEMQGAFVGLQVAVKSQEEHLHTLERFRIPEVESRMNEIQRDSCPQELVDVLGAIHGLHSTTLEEARWRRKTPAERLLITAGAWAGGSLSKLDVALLFFSRWLLLGKPWSGRSQGAAGNDELRQQVLRAAVLICSTEVSWRGLRATEKALPWPLNRLAAWPAKPCLRVMRAACWGALVVLITHEARKRWPAASEAAMPYLRCLYEPSASNEEEASETQGEAGDEKLNGAQKAAGLRRAGAALAVAAEE